MSISLLPTESIYTTPWHCTIGLRLDGTLESGMRAKFEGDDNFELIFENDRPSYFRERSELYGWAETKGGVICEPLYPSGLLIKPCKKGAMSIEDVDAVKVRALSERNSPIVLRGFTKTTDRDRYIKKARDFGQLLPWKFGLVLEVKDQGSNSGGLNNVLSSEWMPFHFDGLFKTEKQENSRGEQVLVPVPPR